MELFSDVILTLGKLLNPQVNGLLELQVLLLEPLRLLTQHLQVVVILFVVLEGPVQFLLLDLELVQQRGPVDKISTLQLCISVQIFVLFLNLLDLHLEILPLNDELIQVVRPGNQKLDSFLLPLQFILVGVHASLIGLLLVVHENQGAFLILADVSLLLLASDTAISFFFHMVEDLFVELFKTGSELLVLFPDLYLVEFGVVSEFGHVLVPLRVGEVGIVDGGQGSPGGSSSQTHH